MEHMLMKRAILCLQPNPEPCDWLRRTLPEYDCVFAATAYDALRNLNSRSFDAYVIEYWLPDWSGPSLCREIRKNDPNSPVVFLADAQGENEQKRALRAGASAYLCKPVEAEVLIATLQKLFLQCDLRSMGARSKAEDALRDVLQRGAAAATAAPERDLERSLERIARTRACKAFIASGGTRSYFESWWPRVFEGARANSLNM